MIWVLSFASGVFLTRLIGLFGRYMFNTPPNYRYIRMGRRIDDYRALATSKALLESHLSGWQKFTLAKFGDFSVRRFLFLRLRITDAEAENTVLYLGPFPITIICIVSEDMVPRYDQMLAIMLLYKTNLKRFFSKSSFLPPLPGLASASD